MYYVWTVLCFGWCASPYIYHSLNDAVAQYLRSEDIPTSAWLDDFWMSNSRVTRDLSPTGQKKVAREAVALALTIVHRCGYFMAFPKCSLEPTTDIVFLGVGCDTVQRRFYVPEDKLRKLEVTLRDVTDSQSISFSQLEKLAGKCTSMSVAVPPVSLYTHHMYRQIATFKRSGGRKDLSSTAVSERSGLRFERERWIEVGIRLHRAPWYDATPHVLTISVGTDASSQAWGGLIKETVRSVFCFQSSCRLPGGIVQRKYYAKETFALHEVLKLATTTHQGYLKGSTAVVDVNNKTMHDAFKKGCSWNMQTHDYITKLFCLQVKEDLTLELRWDCSEANWATDSLTRPERTEHVRLSQAAFNRLSEIWGGGDMDLMETDTSAQRAPIGGGLIRRRLPFYSRFHTNGTVGVDVFSHNTKYMPGSLQKCLGHCFPQPS